MRLWPLNSNPESEQDDGKEIGAKVFLNVYDLTTANDYFYMFGIGIYHSGIEVHGMEYAFGAHEYPTSGVFEVEPRSCPGFIFRRSVLLGTTNMSISEFRCFMESLASSYHGDTYHLIAKNCNHFTDEVCQQLTGKPIPAWVNRLARVGSFCNCLLPESLQVAAVAHIPERLAYSDDERSDFEGLTSSGSETENEDADQNLLASPNPSETTYVKENQNHNPNHMRLARELL